VGTSVSLKKSSIERFIQITAKPPSKYTLHDALCVAAFNLESFLDNKKEESVVGALDILESIISIYKCEKVYDFYIFTTDKNLFFINDPIFVGEKNDIGTADKKIGKNERDCPAK
jgi:hypothetical protein